MKKTLMSIVLGAAAMVLMVGGVKAADGCTLAPGTDENTCGASVDGEGFTTAGDALDYAIDNGGELTFYGSYTLANGVDKEITKNVSIIMYDENDTLTVGASSKGVIVKTGASLTLKGEKISVATPIKVENGASLTIDGKVTSTASNMIETNGDVTITSASEITATSKNVVYANSGAAVSLNGTIKAQNIATFGNSDALLSPAVVTVSGGTIEASGIAFSVANDASLTIEGGNIKATKQAVLITDGNATINGGTIVSTGEHTVQTNTANKGSLKINGGTIIATADGKYALYLNNDKATYALTGGTVESKGNDDAAAILLGSNMIDTNTGELKASLQGIITGGSYLNKIVGVVKNAKTGKNYDASTQLVKAGVAIETKDGYKVVGEGSQANTNEQTTAPESQEPTGNTADAKNPGTSDNFMSLISMVTASAAGLFITS